MKQRIPNEYLLDNLKTVNTKNYGQLLEKTLYAGYFYPMLVKSKLKAVCAKFPYKVILEIDNEKLKKLPKNEQSFFTDSIERSCLNSGYVKEEMNIFELATEDVIYLL